MQADKENTSSYLQTSFQSPAVANYDRCNASSASHAQTIRPLTSGMAASSESEVTSCLAHFCSCLSSWPS